MSVISKQLHGDIELVKAHISKGNKKLPKTTWIFNSGSATNCPSLKLGLCQAGKECYSLKAERQYPQVLPYRERQNKITQTLSAERFAMAFKVLRDNSKKWNDVILRFNEAGDFLNQEQLDWFTRVCELLNQVGIKCYGYTARTDLNLSNLLKVASVMVSNDKGDWLSKGANRFKKYPKGGKAPKFDCAGDCRVCKMCLNFKGKVIGVESH